MNPIQIFLQEATAVELYAEQVQPNILPPQTYYHLSTKYLGKSVRFLPRIPANTFIRKKLENWNTARISTSANIDGALMAMSSDIKGRPFYIYTIKANGLKGIDNKDLLKYVPDAHLTKEVWIMEPTTFKFQYEIEVIEALKGYRFKLLDGKTFTTWSWKWNKASNSLRKT